MASASNNVGLCRVECGYMWVHATFIMGLCRAIIETMPRYYWVYARFIMGMLSLLWVYAGSMRSLLWDTVWELYSPASVCLVGFKNALQALWRCISGRCIWLLFSGFITWFVAAGCTIHSGEPTSFRAPCREGWAPLRREPGLPPLGGRSGLLKKSEL